MARSLARNTKVFASTLVMDTTGGGTLFTQANADTTNTWEIKVLDGYSFSQDTTNQEVGVNEAGTNPVRGTLSFNTALNPVDVTFSTYVRPYDDATDTNKTNCVERPLWLSTLGTSTTGIGGATDTIEEQTAGTPGNFKLGLKGSNTNQLLSLTLFFVLENTCYVVEDFNVSTAEVDFSIDGIATINWSGFGSRVTENKEVWGWLKTNGTFVKDTDYKGVPDTTTNTFLRNKLSTLKLKNNAVDTPTLDNEAITTLTANTLNFTATSFDSTYLGGRVHNPTRGTLGDGTTGSYRTIIEVTDADTIVVDDSSDGQTAQAEGWVATDLVDIYLPTQEGGVVYDIPITGGTITIENNFNYLTPEELAIVNLPLAGFSGNRVTSGSLTAYLNTGAEGTGGLLQDMLAKIEQSVTNNYELIFSMGGSGVLNEYPRVDFTIGYAQVSVPTTSVEDLISTEISFQGKPYDVAGGSASFEDTNEIIIEYKS